MKYVVSTLTRPQYYAFWETISGIGHITGGVHVKGGAGVASSGPGSQIYTPDGVRTEVSNEDADRLLSHRLFNDHMKGGFVKIVNKAEDPDKAARSMESKDGSRPKTPADVEAFSKDAQKKNGPEAGVSAVTNKAK